MVVTRSSTSWTAIFGLFLTLYGLSVESLTLSSSNLTVQVDDLFPRPLNYTHTVTGETLQGALTGWNFHLSLSINNGQVTCGETGLSTVYSPLSSAAFASLSSMLKKEGLSALPNDDLATTDARIFVTTAVCILNWPSSSTSSSSSSSSAPQLVTVVLNGTVAVADDPIVSGGGTYTWSLQSATVTPSLLTIETLTVVGMELSSFHPVPQATTCDCMYKPDDEGHAPKCGGDFYYTDAWSDDGLDEWYAPTWDQWIVAGNVDVNTPAGGNTACLDGVASRHSIGPYISNIVGGWSSSAATGTSIVTTQKHTPFWTGLRAYDLPGRCSVFTIAPAPIQVNLLCGNVLPYIATVGIFPDITQDQTVNSDDIYLWRRTRFPKADVLYRSTLPYKIQVDMTAYTQQHNWNIISFDNVLSYVQNFSLVTDSYPQTPILVGWQGLGHDTLYPSWDKVDWIAGSTPGLDYLSANLVSVSNNSRSSLSYHVNSDEAYSLFNGTANTEFDIGICRLNVDHASAWYSNCTVTQEQIPNCGIRCSISKSKDSAFYQRYERYGKFFNAVPPGSKTIHSDAWRDVGASWDPNGFISWESEMVCGQQADSNFWANHNMSLGVEGQNGAASDLLGVISFFYHADGWDINLFGRIVTGSSLGYDLDVYCDNPGGSCGWVNWANNFYLTAKLYQLALTDEMLTSVPSSLTTDKKNTSSSIGTGYYRFANGGQIYHAHTKLVKLFDTLSLTERQQMVQDVPTPSTWNYGGDSIPVINSQGGSFIPLILGDGTMDPNTIHAYLHTNNSPDPSCPLYTNDNFVTANNTALGDWNSPPYSQYEIDPSLPEIEAVQMCNSSCWTNTSCNGWDMIKVTPYSGKTKPLCMLFTTPVGCAMDDNQWAGTKYPLNPNQAGLNQTWTLPLSWIGSSIVTTTLSPSGPILNTPSYSIQGRNITLINMQPGMGVRLVRT